MIRRLFLVTSVVAALMTGAGTSMSAQQAAAPAKPPVDPISFKVTVVLSRWTGEKAEKRVSSVPFTLFVPNGERSSVRMGGQIPVPSLTKHESGQVTTSASYQAVGTNVDVLATGVPVIDGRHRFRVTVTDNQVSLNSTSSPADSSTLQMIRSMPTYQNFSSETYLLIRDGETMTYTTATDKISGEVTKVEVTLNVLK